MSSDISKKIEENSYKVGVIGLGYVGIPLALGFSGKGIRVIGFDIDEKKITSLSEGKSYLEHIPSDHIANHVTDGSLQPTSDFKRISEVDAIILCVPTPLDSHLEPDLSYVEDTLKQILPHLRDGQIISLESTTYPGTTTEIVQPIIESNGLKVGESVFLVYSPEREDPGNECFSSISIPKILGGVTKKCLEEVGVAMIPGIAFGKFAVDNVRLNFATSRENISKAIEKIDKILK